MRLWHYKLLEFLPRAQLLSQWRECCCIARNISINGTPNHLLVNKILNYPDGDFNSYAWAVFNAIKRRGYRCDFTKFQKWRKGASKSTSDEIFKDWHNDRYLKQCLFNLQEKADCGGFSHLKWRAIYINFKNFIEI